MASQRRFDILEHAQECFDTAELRCDPDDVDVQGVQPLAQVEPVSFQCLHARFKRLNPAQVIGLSPVEDVGVRADGIDHNGHIVQLGIQLLRDRVPLALLGRIQRGIVWTTACTG